MKRKVGSALAALLGAAMVVGLAPAAMGQAGYPPGPCTPRVGVQGAGAHAVRTTFTIHLSPACAWDPGTPVTITVNGVGVGAKTADGSGGVTVTITVASTTILEINDPVQAPANCGGNSAVGTGRSSAAGGATVTQTANFQVLCAQPAAAVSRGGGVAFTGANVLRWGGIAVLLIGAGGLLVFGARRRRARPAS